MSIDYRAHLPVGFVDDPERGPIYEKAPTEADDLTQIHGVGQVLEAQLNLNGVYRFEQIALWTPSQIEAFGKQMPMFQDRIERNYWILQAQRIIERRLATPLVAGGSIEDQYRDDARPAGTIQTVMMIAIALFIGLLLVQWLDGGEGHRFAGRLNAHTFFAVAATSGTLNDLSIAEGDQVLENQEIGRLIDSDRDAAIKSKNAELVLLARRLEQAQATADLEYEWRSNDIDKEIALQRRYIVMARSGSSQYAQPGIPRVTPRQLPVNTASAKGSPMIFFPRTQPRKRSNKFLPASQQNEQPGSASLYPRKRLNIPSAAELIQASYEPDAVSDAATPLELAEARIERLGTLKKKLRVSIERASGVQSAQAAYAKAQEELNTLNSASNDVTLQTEGYGIVSKCFCKTGDQLRRGQKICELIDCRTQYVAALVPSQQVDAIKPGMKVSLYFPGDQHRRGRINSLPVRATQRTESGESMVEIRVEPMGGLWPTIPIGSHVEVAIPSSSWTGGR